MDKVSDHVIAAGLIIVIGVWVWAGVVVNEWIFTAPLAIVITALMYFMVLDLVRFIREALDW